MPPATGSFDADYGNSVTPRSSDALQIAHLAAQLKLSVRFGIGLVDGYGSTETNCVMVGGQKSASFLPAPYHADF
jgi:hypothetical protein